MSASQQPNRLRQIAILLSSVDATTARQLLLHLPTSTAKQVRAIASTLGTVSPEEKQRVLAEFQQSTSPATQPKHAESASSSPNSNAPAFNFGGAAAPTETMLQPDTGDQQTWTKLSVEALIRFVKQERPPVVAVVVSQLSPEVAVQVLQELPYELGEEILTRVSQLQNVDSAALTQIDDYLSERLTEYQRKLDSESENKRKVQALLLAAPRALRDRWQTVLSPDFAIAENETEQSGSQPVPSTSQDASTEPLGDTRKSVGATIASAETLDDIYAGVSANRAEQVSAEEHGSESTTVLPFPKTQRKDEPSELRQTVDHSLVQLEFERIIRLSPDQLARVLSESEAETVLLALAGASPQFMQQFYGLLRPNDAQALRERLQQIGAMTLRDIDEAQQRIVEMANRIVRAKPTNQSRRPDVRQAA